MKRWILVIIVLIAAILTIHFMVNGWNDNKSHDANTEATERPVLGRDAVTGAAATPVTGDSVSVDTSDDETLSATGSAVSDTRLGKISREYTWNIILGRTDAVLENATDDLKKQLTAKDIDLSFESITSSLGAYVGIESVNEQQEKGYPTVTATLRYEGNEGATIRYVYADKEKLAGIWFDNVRLSTAAEKGSKYEESKISIGRNPYILDGILTLPVSKDENSSDKPPLVILLSDIRDADMDGTLGAASNKPLRDMAHGLALRGIASIRYNKRLNQYGNLIGANAGIRSELIRDAEIAIDAASYEAKVDSDAIYVLAWGEAAEYLPAILEKRIRRVCGAIMIGARPTKHMEMDYTDEKTKIETDARVFISTHKSFPLMFIQGDKDFETPVKEFERWQTLLTGRANTAYHLYKNLGHYMFAAGKEPSSADYDVAQTLNSGVITDIANWCEQNKPSK